MNIQSNEEVQPKMYWLRLFVILSFLLVCHAWLWRRKSGSSSASNRATRSSSRRPPIRSLTDRRPRSPSIRRPSIRRPSIRRSPRIACSSKVSCVSCTSHRTWTGACRWCRVDGLCHTAGAIFTNPCRRSQNIVNKWNCNRTPKTTVKPTTSKPITRRPTRTRCIVKTNCISCTNHKSWSGASCRWCPKDSKCHAHGAIFTNPCRRSQNIVNNFNCNRTPTTILKPTTSKPTTHRPTKARCITKTDCISCTNHLSWSGASCRWCPKDEKCHAHGAIFTNPCRRSQNIVNKFNCNRTTTTTPKPTTRRPTKARCITKTNCISCTNHLSWSRFPCRWCPVDEKCHAHGAIFTNPCRRSQNIVNNFNCNSTPIIDKETNSKLTTRLPQRTHCIKKTNCSSCTSHTSWSGASCRWCPKDEKCHAHGAIFTNPCSRSQNIVDKRNCNRTTLNHPPMTRCKTKKNCSSCTSNLSWSGFPCRWCPVDGKCHAHGAVATNLCCPPQNIVKTENCPKPSLPSSYDQNLSYKMVVLSALAYADNVSVYISKAAEVDTFRLVKQVTKPCHSLICLNRTYCSGFIAVSQKEKVIAIVFRGSQSGCQAIGVHGWEVITKSLKETYFQNSFQKVWNDLKEDVYNQIKNHSSYKLWVTGYSLGGALASLASLHIARERKTPKNNLILYTFGQPKTGDCQYAFAHNKLVPISFRVVHYRDPVVHLPPYFLPRICGACGPYHHGREIFYNQRVMSKDSPYKTCNGPEDVACSKQFSFRPSLQDHIEYFGINVPGWWKEK